MTHRPPRAARRRRGSVYLVVSGVAVVVATIALASAGIGRIALRQAGQAQQLRQARAAAQSGLEFGMNWLATHDDWRSTLASGTDSAELAAAGARFVWRVTDADGDLANDPRHQMTLRAEGRSGASAAALEATIGPASRGVNCLEASLFAATAITLESGSSVDGAGFLATNGSCTATGATVKIDVDAVGDVTGTVYQAGTYPAVAARETPGRDVFAWCLARGTRVPVASLAPILGTRLLTGVVMSPQSNPFGDANPWGVYVIDCQGQSISISGMRLYGTLVLLNAGPSTGITDVVHMQPIAPNYPSLMVDGPLQTDMKQLITNSRVLSEGGMVNFNPPGAPYLGVTDSDKSDTYPARVEGVVYVTGELCVKDDSEFLGSVVAGTLTVKSSKTLTVNGQRYAYDYPPPGFATGGGVRVLPAGVRRASR